jgi:DNA-binding response OmpR family regulator
MARVLIVDDEQDVRQMMHDALRLRGHVVDVAASPDEAIGLASNNSYEVAIIDYVLPGKRGLELLHELRKRDPFLRAIIISGQIDHDVLDSSTLERELKERVAADRYLAKPAMIEDLERAIQEVLRPSAAGSWQQMASDAVAAHEVKRKQVQDMDRKLRKAKKKK